MIRLSQGQINLIKIGLRRTAVLVELPLCSVVEVKRTNFAFLPSLNISLIGTVLPETASRTLGTTAPNKIKLLQCSSGSEGVLLGCPSKAYIRAWRTTGLKYRGTSVLAAHQYYEGESRLLHRSCILLQPFVLCHGVEEADAPEHLQLSRLPQVGSRAGKRLEPSRSSNAVAPSK